MTNTAIRIEVTRLGIGSGVIAIGLAGVCVRDDRRGEKRLRFHAHNKPTPPPRKAGGARATLGAREIDASWVEV